MWLIGLIVTILVFAADQLSKYWLAANLNVGEVLHLCDYFNIVRVWNTGVSFSMFSNQGMLGVILLSLLSFIICCFLGYWMYHEYNRLKVVALGLIIGGAFGNMVDRIRFGAVSDFLDFHIKNYHWPAFNIADTCICIGAMVLIIMEILQTRRKGER